MSRNPYGNLSTIEYIGARPQKPKKNFFGGWVILVIAAAMALIFGRPLLSSVKAEQVTASVEAADEIIASLNRSNAAGDKIASAALTFTKNDKDALKVNSTSEMIIKCYRVAIGLDIKELLHEDMTQAFSEYPQLWYEREANKEVDSTRVPNILRFFHRSGEDFQHSEMQIGDVMFWTLPDGNAHAGIVVPGPGQHNNEKWIVHNWQGSVLWENKLKDFTMVSGCYRFGR